MDTGVWHWTPMPVGGDSRIICSFAENTSATDVDVRKFPAGEVLEVLMANGGLCMSRLFKIGATAAMGAPDGSPFPISVTDYTQTADWLKYNGFDTMEVHIRAPQMIDGPKLQEHCLRIGMEISSIGTGMAYGMEGLSLTSSDEQIRRRAVTRLKDQLDLGRILACPVIIGSMRGLIETGETFSLINKRMTDAMKELAEYAEKTDGELVIEAIDRFETNYLRTAQDVLELIEDVGSTRVKVHLDTFHMNLEEQDWRRAILSCKGRLGHVHVADNSRNYPGWGLIDFRQIMSLLLEIGYNRSLTLECFPVPDGETALRRGLKHLDAHGSHILQYVARQIGR
mgnify:CR=1 FL=1